MKKSITIISLLSLLTLSACSGPNQEDDKNRLKVSATFYPLAYLSQEIGGDFVNVTQITPGGIEPHDYEPTPQDLATIQSSQVFIMHGYGIDTWAENILTDLKDKNITVIEAGKKAEVVADDPHVWLNPKKFQKEAEAVRDAFVEADPAHAQQYKLNATGLISDLVALDREYREGLADCKIRKIVTSHDAFGYLAQEYNFESLAIAGISPEEEPSPKRLAELTDFARKNNVKYIFFEELVSPKLAETLAVEVGAESLVLNPIEGLTEKQQLKSEDYLILMQRNLQNLRTAMQCR